jgi:hypothetical protein
MSVLPNSPSSTRKIIPAKAADFRWSGVMFLAGEGFFIWRKKKFDDFKSVLMTRVSQWKKQQNTAKSMGAPIKSMPKDSAKSITAE